MNIPIEQQVWDSQECADYLRESRGRFMRTTRFAFAEGFPKQLAMSEGKHPRWSAAAVVAWALKP